MRYGEWVVVVKRTKDMPSQPTTSKLLYTVTDVMEDKTDTTGCKEVLVQWDKWTGPTERVKLTGNYALKQYLDQNRANPYSSTLARKAVLASDLGHLNVHVQAVRQAMFDSLGANMTTPDGQRGCVSKSSISLPFPKDTFDSVFRCCRLSELPPEQTANIKCLVTHDFLTEALGSGWGIRESHNSSTQVKVNASRPITLEWGYTPRSRWDHSFCQR